MKVLSARTGQYLIAGGLAVNLLDLVTDRKVFGAGGWLEPVNKVIPEVRIPIKGTEGIAINIAGWSVAAGIILLLYLRYK